MSMEQWWNDTDRGKLKYWEKLPLDTTTSEMATTCKRVCSVFGEERGSKMNTVYLEQIIHETTSYCWILWAVLEASTNTATYVQTENTVKEARL